MGLNLEGRNEILSMISEHQMGKDTLMDRGCAPVTVQIGGVAKSGQCEHDNLILKDACPAVVTLVHEWAKKNSHFVSMTHQGLEIR